MARRKRFRTPRRSRKRFWIRLTVFGVIALLLFLFASIRVRPMVQGITASVAKQMMTNRMHQVVLEKLAESDAGYPDFVHVEKGETGEITSISLNTTAVNLLKSEVALAIQQELGKEGKETGIPIGTLTGIDLLRGRGPSVPLRVSMLGNLTMELQSTFDAAGINQTRHQISLQITTDAYAYLVGASSAISVQTTVPIAETIIVGQVPQTYASLTPEIAAGSQLAGATG